MSRNRAGESSNLKKQNAVKRKLVYCMIGAMTLTSSMVFSDQITLRSGQVVNGAIESDSGSEYIVKTELGSISVKKQEVVNVKKIGTTAAEIEGDIAFKKGDTTGAEVSYNAALRQAAPNSEAAQRISERIATIQRSRSASSNAQLQSSLAQAHELITLRRPTEAVMVLEKLRVGTEITPQQHAAINSLLAHAYYSKGVAARDNIKEIEAQAAFREAINLDPQYYPSYTALGELLLKSSATDNEGIQSIEKGMKIAGNTMPEMERYRLYFLLGDRYFIKQKYDLAAANFAEVIPARDKYPAYAEALDKTVEAYVKTGEQSISSDFQKTIDNLRQALKLNPNNKKALFLLGRLYSDSGQTENAIMTLENLVKIDPRYHDAHHYLGMAYANARDLDKAVGYLSKELENRPNDYSTLVDRAQIYVEMREFEKAKADIDAATALRKDDWNVHFLAAESAYKQKSLDDAQTALKKALEYKSDAIPSHILMGRILLAQNDSAAARQWLEQVANVLGKAPNLGFKQKNYYVETLSELATMDLEQNRPLQAAEKLEQALAAVPNNPSALASLGDVKRKLSQESIDVESQKKLMAEAEGEYKKAISIDPLNPENYLKLGVLYHNDFKDLPKALEYYMLYADKGGKDPRVNTWLVEVGGKQDPRLVPPQATPSITSVTLNLNQLTSGTDTLTSGVVAPLEDPAATPTQTPL